MAGISLIPAIVETAETGAPFWTLGNSLLVASTAFDALGSIAQGESQAKAAEANAEAIRRNAAFNEQQQRRQGQARLSAINTAYGKSGVQMEGTPIEVLSQQAGEIELDALATRWMGENESIAKKYEASKYRTSGYIGAGSSLLAGGAKIYDAYDTWKNPKKTGTSKTLMGG